MNPRPDLGGPRGIRAALAAMGVTLPDSQKSAPAERPGPRKTHGRAGRTRPRAGRRLRAKLARRRMAWKSRRHNRHR